MRNLDSKSVENPTLSLITVSAFESHRLIRTLKSVQGLEANIEHIFVIPFNDESSRKTILDYSKKTSFNVAIRNDEKHGIYPAMNIGINFSNGRYCLFLNAGDEIFSQKQFKENILAIEQSLPTWAIFGCSLPWNNSYVTYPNMEKAFLRQVSGAYVSHQSVAVSTSKLVSKRGFDTSFRIAADTLMTMELANESAPLLLEGIAIKVEQGNTVTASNRLSRFETLRAIVKLENNYDKLIALINTAQKEFKFMVNKAKSFSRNQIKSAGNCQGKR